MDGEKIIQGLNRRFAVPMPEFYYVKKPLASVGNYPINFE